MEDCSSLCWLRDHVKMIHRYIIHYPPVCGDVEEGGGDEAGDLPLGGVISAHLHRVARQQRPAALPHPRLAPGDILVDIPVDIIYR